MSMQNLLYHLNMEEKEEDAHLKSELHSADPLNLSLFY